MNRLDRPLVTFVVYAYRQEHYVRSAIEAAFAQDWAPLEIILSDDASPDGTFAVMQAMAAAYTGPHRVTARRNEPNLGIVQHVRTVGQLAAGEIVVMAAGDDIALPGRTAASVAAILADDRVDAVTTGYRFIDDRGRVTSGDLTVPVAVAEMAGHRSYVAAAHGPVQVIQGSTAAYRRRVFGYPLPDWRPLATEDNLFNVAIAGQGRRVALVPSVQVLYRRHDGAVANRPAGPAQRFQAEPTDAAPYLSEVARLGEFLWIAGRSPRPEGIDVAGLRADIADWQAKADWGARGLVSRLSALAGALRQGRRGLAKWMALRLFGRAPGYQPRAALVALLSALRRGR